MSVSRSARTPVALVLVTLAFLVLLEDAAFGLWRGTVVAPYVKDGLGSLGTAGLVGFALLAGVLAGVSPSAYPYLPALATAAVRLGRDGRRRRAALAAGVGAAAITLLAGLGAGVVGLAAPIRLLKPAAAVVLVLAGLTMAVPQFRGLVRRALPRRLARSPAMACGAGYAFACLPCKLAVVAALAAYAAASGRVLAAALAFVAYALAFGAVTLGFTFLSAEGSARIGTLAGRGRDVRLAAGVVVAASGLWMLKLFAETGM